MQINGAQLLFDESIVRPVIRGEILISERSWQKAQQRIMRYVSEDHWFPLISIGYDTWRPMYAARITVLPIDGKGVECEQWLLGDDRCKA